MNNNKITINKEFDLKYNIDVVKLNIKKLYTENIYKMKYTYLLGKEMDSLNYFRIENLSNNLPFEKESPNTTINANNYRYSTQIKLNKTPIVLSSLLFITSKTRFLFLLSSCDIFFL